jgi:hypothetical protein
MRPNRRDFCKLVAAAPLVASPLGRALAAAPKACDEFFILIHAAGGWDVTLWSDPRNERKGLIEPPSTDNTDIGALHHWKDAPLDGGTRTFEPVETRGMRLGPAIGGLYDLADRITIFNGLTMNTVSHPDGIAYSFTGRHLQGPRSSQASIDTVLASELGAGQTLPAVSVQFPSAFIDGLDRRAAPLVVDRIASISRSLSRSRLYDSDADRDAVTVLLSDEARQAASRSTLPGTMDGFAVQLANLRRMLTPEVQEIFDENKVRALHKELNFGSRNHASAFAAAAFAIEAMRRNLVRCVGFTAQGFDTHSAAHKNHALLLQDLFDLIALFIKQLDKTPHPTRTGRPLSAHTHILVLSDFCRTPMINVGGGRDHYPNNSALVISPKIKSGIVVGKSDAEQLLPAGKRKFADGERPISPPDLLTTFVSAFGVDVRRWFRDGEQMPELLTG